MDFAGGTKEKNKPDVNWMSSKLKTLLIKEHHEESKMTTYGMGEKT